MGIFESRDIQKEGIESEKALMGESAKCIYGRVVCSLKPSSLSPGPVSHIIFCTLLHKLSAPDRKIL